MNLVATMPMVCLLALCGCQVQTKAELYLSDIKKVARDGTEVQTPIDFLFEVVSAAECQTALDPLQASLNRYYTSVTMKGCESEGINTFAVARVMASIIQPYGDSIEQIKEPIYVSVDIGEDDDPVTVAFGSTPASISEFQQSLPDQARKYLSGAPDIRLAASLHNDMPGNATIVVQSAFSNDYPVAPPFSFNYETERRDNLEIRLSDVANAAFSKYDMPGVIALIPVEALDLSRSPAPDLEATDGAE